MIRTIWAEFYERQGFLETLPLQKSLSTESIPSVDGDTKMAVFDVPRDFLTELMSHPDEVASRPERFMPRNYHQNLAELSSVA